MSAHQPDLSKKMEVGYMSYRIPFIKPSFPDAKQLSSDYESIVKSNWFTNFGPFEQRFRDEIKSFLGLPVEVCTVANATMGLAVAIEALFNKNAKGSKVIMPSFTFAAGAGVLVNMGYEPVFIDIDSNWQPDIRQARGYILKESESISGILLCNIFGVGNPQISKWEKLAHEYNLPIIIDSAAGFGSKYTNSEYIGGRGDCEVFSLHATKPFGVGEGGLIISRNKKLVEQCRSLTNFGFNSNRKVDMPGTNAKMQEISCAIGLRQIKSLKKRIEGRQESLSQYKSALQPYGYMFQSNDHISTVPFVSTMVLSSNSLTGASLSLSKIGVEHKFYYDPLHTQPAFERYVSEDNGINLDTTDFTVGRILSLPLHDHMKRATINEITKCMIDSND